MAKIDPQKFCENVVSCKGAPYVSPGSTSLTAIQKGAGVDCSGLLVAAGKPLGGSWEHGSNSMWRKDLTDKGRISDGKPTDPFPAGNDLKSSQLQIGMAVFKHTNTDTKKYPDGLGNFVHVGVVTGVHPLRITHASTETKCVTTDTKIGKWCAWGKLKGIVYDSDTETEEASEETEEETEEQKGERTMENATGRLKTTSTMNLRKGPGTGYDKIGSVPRNTELDFIGDLDDDWVEVEYNGKDGYICTHQGKFKYVEGLYLYDDIDDEAAADDEEEDTEEEDTEDEDPVEEDAGISTDEELRDTVSELCEGSVIQTNQITAICRILKEAGYDISSVPGMRL